MQISELGNAQNEIKHQKKTPNENKRIMEGYDERHTFFAYISANIRPKQKIRDPKFTY